MMNLPQGSFVPSVIYHRSVGRKKGWPGGDLPSTAEFGVSFFRFGDRFMPVAQLQTSDGRTRAFEHRGSQADLGVFEQIFVAEDYSLGRLRRGRELVQRYETILASGKTPIIVDAGANIGA
ncbi:MAG: hypothetical protein ACK5S0_00840 [bacterium]|jgi:hypothetical protein